MLSIFPRGVLDEILNLVESVSEDFPSYFSIHLFVCLNNDDNNNNKTGQVELSARQVNYYYFKNTLMGAVCPFIGKAGV